MGKISVTLAFLLAVAVSSFGYGGYLYSQLGQENNQLKETITTLEENLESTAAELRQTQGAKAETEQTLKSEQDKNIVFEAKINEVSTIVGNLQKLSVTDPELLKKYSKVYFLSENYIPSQLSSVDQTYLYEQSRPQLVHSGAIPYLRKILDSASQDGINLRVISAYRSFYDQETVKAGHSVVYGSGANQFSADQGYSEHQLGTAVDFTTTETEDNFLAFEKSPAFQWLNDSAYRFGFILSYPKNNTYYQFESWHWRFVGVALATYLHDQNRRFYDLDQREIDNYRISLFN